MIQGKKERKRRIVARLEALLGAGEVALLKHAAKVLDDQGIKGSVKGRVLPWIRERIRGQIEQAKRPL